MAGSLKAEGAKNLDGKLAIVTGGARGENCKSLSLTTDIASH